MLPVVVVVVVVVMGIMMVVVMVVMMGVVVVVVVVVMIGIMMAVVVVVMVTSAVVTPEALAQCKLGGQLSDRLPLVKDSLLLPHKAFAQVQDGGFGLVRHHATPVTAVVAIGVWTMGYTGWRIAAGVCFWWDWSANKFGADSIVMFYARQTACCCCT